MFTLLTTVVYASFLMEEIESLEFRKPVCGPKQEHQGSVPPRNGSQIVATPCRCEIHQAQAWNISRVYSRKPGAITFPPVRDFDGKDMRGQEETRKNLMMQKYQWNST